MRHVYRLATHQVISDIELPELTSWDERIEPSAVLRFELGTTSQTAGPRTYVVPGPRRIVIEDGARVTVEITQDDDLADIRALLMGPVQAVLWHQRGLLPLHASAVSVDRNAVVFAGPSGAGKSTFAAVLSRRGHPVLADDIAIIDPKTVLLFAGQSRLRLWKETLNHLEIPPENLPRAMSRSEKYLVKGAELLVPEKQRLKHIVLLVRTQECQVQMAELTGSEATLAVAEVVHMLPAAHELGLGAAVFFALTKLQRSGVRIWRFMFPHSLDTIEDVADVLLTNLDR